jgi:hypothetical protein
MAPLRCKFSLDISKLIQFINQYDNGHYSCALGEVERSLAEAEKNATEHKGIVHSLHILGLAADIHIYLDGVYLSNGSDYKFAGDYWKSLDSLNCSGGDFKTNPDGNHFSQSYGGVK